MQHDVGRIVELEYPKDCYNFPSQCKPTGNTGRCKRYVCGLAALGAYSGLASLMLLLNQRGIVYNEGHPGNVGRCRSHW